MILWKFDRVFWGTLLRPLGFGGFRVVLFLVFLASVARADSVDLLVFGDIYTVNGARSWATAMAVRDGRIVFVGSAKDAAKYRNLNDVDECKRTS